MKVKSLPEASGLAASRRVPGRLWSHNDSGEPVLFALDANGAVSASVTLTGATVEDWEAIAVAPCGAGSCLYVGDIGDNEAARKRITVYRLAEPAGAAGNVASEAIHATYPDGSHDAETLLATPDGNLFVVTKGDTGPVALYRFPRDVRPGASVQLERVGKPRSGGKSESDRITDGTVSADGQWVALRTKTSLIFYRAADLLAGNWREAGRVDVTSLGEPQGEGVAFAADRSVYVASEGGGKSQPGTLGRLTCAAPR